MNKALLLLTAGLIFKTSVIIAQNFSFGPALGANLMAVDKDDLGTVYKPTLNGGGFVTYQLTDHFGLRSGIYYSQKTHTNSQLDTGLLNLFGLENQLPEGVQVDLSTYSIEKSRISQFYLELPLLASYKLEWFNAYLGPYVGYMLHAKRTTFSSTTIPFLQAIDVSGLDPTGGTFTAFLPPPYSEDISDSNSKKGLTNWQFGLQAGIGVEVQNIGANVFYNYGFLKHRTSVQTGQNKPYSYFNASINYKFSFGKRN